MIRAIARWQPCCSMSGMELSEPTGRLHPPGGVLAQIEPSERAVRLVPERVARRHRAVPIAVDNRVLRYATCTPYSPAAARALGFASGRRPAAVPATRPAVI